MFEQTAERQYHRELLFSQVTELMLSVVLRVEDSVHSAFKARKDSLGVSDQAVYDKLRFRIVTRGQKNMPSYAAQVPPQDRRAAIAYVRSLQGGTQP